MLVTLRGFVPKRLASVYFWNGPPTLWRKRKKVFDLLSTPLESEQVRKYKVQWSRFVKVYSLWPAAKVESFAFIRL